MAASSYNTPSKHLLAGQPLAVRRSEIPLLYLFTPKDQQRANSEAIVLGSLYSNSSLGHTVSDPAEREGEAPSSQQDKVLWEMVRGKGVSRLASI